MPTDARPLSLIQAVADLQRAARRQATRNVGGTPIWEFDTYTITGSTDHAHTLSWLPYGINVVLLNGLGLVEGTDYSCDYTTGVVTVTATLTAGDILHVRYVTTGDLMVNSLTPDLGWTLVDTFDRANSSTTINPASDGGTWTLAGGTTGGISSNQGYIVTGNGVIRRDVGSLSTDVQITNYRPSTTSFSYVQFCYDDGTVSGIQDGYALRFNSSTTMTVVDQRTGTVRATPTGVTAWTGGSTTLRVVYQQATNTVTVYQNGAQIWTGTVSGAVTTGSWVGFSSLTSSIGELWNDFMARPA